MSSEENHQETGGQTRDHRDFPRLHVEAKVRIAGTAPLPSSNDQAAIVSDLSLGGARLSTPAELAEGSDIGLIPFSGLLEDHPLHRVLEFKVMWAGAYEDGTEPGSKWREYGLAHQGSVLDVLNSWLGHLLLRQKDESEIVLQRRQYRRFRFDQFPERPMKARSSHDSQSYELTLLDIAPGGLLARGEDDQIPVGVHLELQTEWDDPQQEESMTSLMGCVVDAHSHSGSTFYRVAFDPDSEFDEEHLIGWAESVGGELDN